MCTHCSFIFITVTNQSQSPDIFQLEAEGANLSIMITSSTPAALLNDRVMLYLSVPGSFFLIYSATSWSSSTTCWSVSVEGVRGSMRAYPVCLAGFGRDDGDEVYLRSHCDVIELSEYFLRTIREKLFCKDEVML